MNIASGRKLLRPLTGLAMIAGLVGAPLATAASAAAAQAPTAQVAAAQAPTVVSGIGHNLAPAENPYCDYRSGYLCESYGYAPDYVPEGHHHYRHQWHHWRHWG